MFSYDVLTHAIKKNKRDFFMAFKNIVHRFFCLMERSHTKMVKNTI